MQSWAKRWLSSTNTDSSEFEKYQKREVVRVVHRERGISHEYGVTVISKTHIKIDRKPCWVTLLKKIKTPRHIKVRLGNIGLKKLEKMKYEEDLWTRGDYYEKPTFVFRHPKQ